MNEHYCLLIFINKWWAKQLPMQLLTYFPYFSKQTYLDLHLGFGQKNFPYIEWIVISVNSKCLLSLIVRKSDIIGSFISTNSVARFLKAFIQFVVFIVFLNLKEKFVILLFQKFKKSPWLLQMVVISWLPKFS